MKLLALDPGNVESGYAVIDENYKPIQFGKISNEEAEYLLVTQARTFDQIVIENLAFYGMPVGRSVLDTAIWIGRFTEICVLQANHPEYVLRKQYVAELTGSAKAKDANVIQYLIDRFAPNDPNRGKGTKKNPGWFYGFKADVWQAYALAIWKMDLIKGNITHLWNIQ